MNEYVVGFDARELWRAGHWFDGKRDQMHYRPVERVRSVDDAIWPSAFDADATLTRPAWCGTVQNLWDDHGTLLSELSRQWGNARRPCALIAVTLVDGAADGMPHWRTELPLHAGIGPEWRLIGYDVADAYLESGLCHRFFQPNENRDALKAQWAPRLNDHHLFDHAVDAASFLGRAAECDAQHAPYFVFGLYEVPTAPP